ncbi:MAG TPA: tetratricopeptide repeat protein, partial [Longimicrobiales bacterium]|nr:tetratricopeptide repeat protein [Longimicrobiales bacterium]
MNRVNRVILSLGLLGLVYAGTGAGEALAQKPSNNMWTRSAALYLDRAQANPNPEGKLDLYRQALEASLEGIKNDGGNPRTWFMAGQAYTKLGELAAADSMFDRAEEIYPDYAQEVNRERLNAWINAYNQGVNLLQAGKTDEAGERLLAAHTIYQGRPEAPLTLGPIYARAQEFDKAIDAYRQALAIMRGPASENLNEQQKAKWLESEEIASFNLAQILASEGRGAEAAEAYRTYLARNPADVTAKINLAVVLTREGDEAEAAKLYTELLETEQLTAENYFRIGLGLFGAEEYERSAAAFERSLTMNPYSRDALYNLGQAVYSTSRQLEQKLSTPDSAQVVNQLKGLYEKLDSVSQRITELDPNNGNAMLLHAQAFRGLSDITKDDAASQALRRKALALLEQQDALEFQVLNVQMLPGPEQGTRIIRGVLMNDDLAAGTPVTLRFILLDDAGAELSSEEVTIPAPEAEQQVPFDLQVAA